MILSSIACLVYSWKIQENPLPEEPVTAESTPHMSNKVDKTVPDKPIPPPTPVVVPHVSVPSFTKATPNDLYRRLLPAVLFLLTFVTVMTMLLIYMDTVALGAQQFRLNMSRDYELARIPQESEPLVAFVRTLHLAPRPPLRALPPPVMTDRARVLEKGRGDLSNGTFISFLPRGPRDPTTRYLESLSWSGVVVRAAPRDYLSLRGAARALHACLSPSAHPREVTWHEAETQEAAFSSRVLCLPLYTVLLAAEATNADYVIMGGDNVVPALHHVPFDKVHLQFIEFRSADLSARNKTTSLLESKNYTIAATFEDGVMYSLKQNV